MKLIKENRKRTKVELTKEILITIEQYIVVVYLFCMVGIFPLYYKQMYYKIGDAKFDFFQNISLCFIGISLVCIMTKLILQRLIKDAKPEEQNSKKILWGFLEKLSTLDYAVFIYAICVILSYAFSDFKDYALKGAAGWEMGLCSQMIFVAIYFILSRQRMIGVLNQSGQNKWVISISSKQSEFTMVILWIHLISSALAFGFGILHRFDIDPLGMYVGLDLYQKIEFLSTIGQATWFSSYVCTVFAVGVIIFYLSEKSWIRTATGIYTVISFGILVTQNSDSAFVAIAGIMLLLGYFSLSDIKKCCRFWQVVCLMWGTFGGIGILQKVFAGKAIPLDSLSIFFSQSMVTWMLLIISLGMLGFYTNMNKNSQEQVQKTMKVTRFIYKGILILVAIGIIMTMIFIYLNTKGYLLEWFGYQSTNQYLLFDYHWGSNRGSTWMVCWQSFLSMPWFQKLFGIGPDSLSAYLYSVPDISDLLHNLWGSTKLTNAHNEYLNSLICYGIVGLASWMAVLIGGIGYFYCEAKEKSFMILFALCIMGYACHNIFCYQQVCCTPFLFIALGIGESLTKSENFNTIK